MNELDMIKGLYGRIAYPQQNFDNLQLELYTEELFNTIHMLEIFCQKVIISFINGDIAIFDLYNLSIITYYKNQEFIKSPPHLVEVKLNKVFLYYINFVIEISLNFKFKKTKFSSKVIGQIHNYLIDCNSQFSVKGIISPIKTIISKIIKANKSTIKQLFHENFHCIILLSSSQVFYISELTSQFQQIDIPFDSKMITNFQLRKNILTIFTNQDAIVNFTLPDLINAQVLRTITSNITSYQLFKNKQIYTSCGPIFPETSNGFFVDNHWFQMPSSGDIYRICASNEDFLVFAGKNILSVIYTSQGGKTPSYQILQIGQQRENLVKNNSKIYSQKQKLGLQYDQKIQFGIQSPILRMLSQNQYTQHTPPLGEFLNDFDMDDLDQIEPIFSDQQ